MASGAVVELRRFKDATGREQAALAGQQVPPVCHLDRFGRTNSSGASVFCRTVARHDLDPRPLLKLLRTRQTGAVWQQVHHAAALQVHDDRPICAPLAYRPIIHGDNPGRLYRGQLQATDQAQHRGAAAQCRPSLPNGRSAG